MKDKQYYKKVAEALCKVMESDSVDLIFGALVNAYLDGYIEAKEKFDKPRITDSEGNFITYLDFE